MVWAVAKRGSMRNGNKDGWLLDCSGTSTDCCTLWGVEFSGCSAEMVAYGEGKKYHNPSGDNQELSFEASDHRFGYGCMEKWLSIHILIWGECGVGADMCTRSPHKSTCQAARESGLSKHTVHRVLKKDLNSRPRKPHYVQELTTEDCDHRMEYGELMLGWHEDWPKLFENILWSDNADFHIGDFVNWHNCHYWAAHNPKVMVEKMQNRPKVTVWCGMMATRVIGPYRLCDTMNAERYLQMLEDNMWPIVSGWENIDELL